MGKYAHFESTPASTLQDLYGNHAEVARQIHEDILRKFTGNNELEVDLVQMNPLDGNEATLEKLSEYDSVSVSSGLKAGWISEMSVLSHGDVARNVREYFETHDMPIYTVAAGNDGSTNNSSEQKLRIADLAKNSLIVGEANISEHEAYIEKHSSLITPTLACDSPFNRGERYQYFNPSPSLEGHEDLIRDWIVSKELKRRCEANTSETPYDELSKEEKLEVYRKIYNEIKEEGFENSQAVNDQISSYMANPDSLHTLVWENISKQYDKHDLDENGFLTGLNGTSFPAPELAGYVSGALYEQEVREEQNLPILTKNEITSLIKMATYDTDIREGSTRPTHMYTYTNDAGNKFTEGGGHGVFSPEMFRNLLDIAYKKIETDPDIDRKNVELKASSDILQKDPTQWLNNLDNQTFRYSYIKDYVAEDAVNSKLFTLTPTPSDGSDIMIDTIQYDINFNFSYTVIPNSINIYQNGDYTNTLYLHEMSDAHGNTLLYANFENQFGETLESDGEEWKISLPGDYEIFDENAQVTIYGYNKGGLMDQMMEYSQGIAQDYAPKPEETTPSEQEPTTKTTISGDQPIIPLAITSAI